MNLVILQHVCFSWLVYNILTVSKLVNKQLTSPLILEQYPRLREKVEIPESSVKDQER